MPVTIKNAEELELMREAGKILAKVHEQLATELKDRQNRGRNNPKFWLRTIF